MSYPQLLIMKKLDKNDSEIKDFISINNIAQKYHDLMFRATIEIITNNNKFTGTAQVRINFDNRGKIVLSHNEDLDPYKFPITFYSRYDELKVVQQILKIKGKHTENSNIGDYTVYINP